MTEFQTLVPADAPGTGQRIRAFFALVPDEATRLRFVTLAREVARRSRGRAITGEHVHLTVAFLGDVETSALPALRAIGDALPLAGAELDFDILGAWRASGWPGWRRPRCPRRWPRCAPRSTSRCSSTGSRSTRDPSGPT